MSKVRKVKDCLYDFITIPPRLYSYVDHPAFQRLRRIAQLGNTEYVYPTATHTRFEHSLGVMHLAGVICKQLKIKGNLRDCVQLAGLYHDIGHLPCSHHFDDILAAMPNPPVTPRHEDRSVIVLRKVAEEVGGFGKDDIDIVEACILGKTLPGYLPAIFQIISNEVDADRLDYLRRDAYHVKLSEFQPNYIISCMGLDAEGNIAFLRKAITELTSLFNTRERMHADVYQNKVCLQYDTLYSCMISRVIGELDFETIDDAELKTILRKHPLTRDTFRAMEYRQKEHTCGNNSHLVKFCMKKTEGLKALRWLD